MGRRPKVTSKGESGSGEEKKMWLASNYHEYSVRLSTAVATLYSGATSEAIFTNSERLLGGNLCFVIGLLLCQRLVQYTEGNKMMVQK